MFKNRTLQMKIVKNPTPAPTEQRPASPWTNPLFINAMIRDNVLDAAKLAAIGYAGKKVIDTSSEIVTLIANAKIK